MSAINSIENLENLTSARLAYMMTNVGALTGRCCAVTWSRHARNGNAECPAAINGSGSVITVA